MHGYEPEVILSGRNINDHMAEYISKEILLDLRSRNVNDPTVTIMGISFKEDCPDMRNSKVLDIVKILHKSGISIQIVDPIVSSNEVFESTKIKLTSLDNLHIADSVVFAVAHTQFKNFTKKEITKIIRNDGTLFDLKNIYKKGYFEKTLIKHWKL